MKNKFTESLLLFFIVLFAAFLYIFKLSEIPNGVYSDEATVGYNAYSIMLTGKDEYGKSFPVAFRFFGAYTPPLFIYAIIPFIKLFGLNAFSLRILSALSTIGGILIIYGVAKKLKLFSQKISPLITALIFSIIPWVVFNARLGYEVTLGYILFFWGVYLVWQGTREKRLSLPGLFILSISTYVAHTERFLVPMFLLAFLILFWKNLKPVLKPKTVYLALAVLILTQLPHFFLITTKAFWVKNNVFEDVGVQRILIDFFSQYLTYLSPSDLFGVSRDINHQHTIPYLPNFYSWLIIPFFIGLYRLYLQRKTLDGKFIWLLLLISPVPGALSGHFLSIQRILPVILPMVLIIGLGLDFLVEKIKPFFFYPAFTFLTLFSLLLLWRSYFVFFPQERAVWWSYGYEELTKITTSTDKQFIFDNSRMPPAYMSFLYHLSFPPLEFQKNFSDQFVKDYYTNPPYNPNYKIGNIDIRPIIWEVDPVSEVVIVGDPLLLSPDQAKEHFLEEIFRINDPFGNAIFIGYQTHPEAKIKDNLRKLRERKTYN